MRHDERERNPALHMLYVKWAVGHLCIIEKAIRQLHDTANLNMTGMIMAMEAERLRLINENAAYADAAEIMQIYRTGRGNEPEGPSDNED